MYLCGTDVCLVDHQMHDWYLFIVDSCRHIILNVPIYPFFDFILRFILYHFNHRFSIENFSFGRMPNLSSISLNSKCLFNLFLVIRFFFVGFSDINMKSIGKMGDCFGIFGYWRSILWAVSHFLMVFCMCKWFGSVHFDSKPHTYSIFHISFFSFSPLTLIGSHNTVHRSPLMNHSIRNITQMNGEYLHSFSSTDRKKSL